MIIVNKKTFHSYAARQKMQRQHGTTDQGSCFKSEHIPKSMKCPVTDVRMTVFHLKIKVYMITNSLL